MENAGFRQWMMSIRAEWPFRLRLGGWPVLIVLLFLACLATGLAAVVTTHQTRVQFAEWQRLDREKNQLSTEWGQLLLEESTWSSPVRIESIAAERLNMRIPDVHDVEVIKP